MILPALPKQFTCWVDTMWRRRRPRVESCSGGGWLIAPIRTTRVPQKQESWNRQQVCWWPWSTDTEICNVGHVSNLLCDHRTPLKNKVDTCCENKTPYRNIAKVNPPNKRKDHSLRFRSALQPSPLWEVHHWRGLTIQWNEVPNFFQSAPTLRRQAGEKRHKIERNNNGLITPFLVEGN